MPKIEQYLKWRQKRWPGDTADQHYWVLFDLFLTQNCLKIEDLTDVQVESYLDKTNSRYLRNQARRTIDLFRRSEYNSEMKKAAEIKKKRGPKPDVVKDKKVWELRKKELSFREISRVMGEGVSVVYDRYARVLKERSELSTV